MKLPIIDGHNDLLCRLAPFTRESVQRFLSRRTEGHLDLPRAREGWLGGGFFAVFVKAERTRAESGDADVAGRGSPALAEPLDSSYALPAAMAMVAGLFRLEAAAAGQIRVVRTVCELGSCLKNDVLAAILHFEGAEAIDADLNALEVFYRAGLRSLGIVWSRPNAFGHGVPFLRSHSPDIGPGLTDAGKALVRACNELGIMIDVSHLNEQGFWDVAKMTEAPIVATHSCAYALCPVPRNLTDKQLDAIRESDGMVGVNFSVSFLSGEDDEDRETLNPLIRHIDYLVDRLGIDRVGFGSDFDGARIPTDIGDAAGLPRLVAALRQRGYDDEAMQKLAHGNWLRVLERTWSPGPRGR